MKASNFKRQLLYIVAKTLCFVPDSTMLKMQYRLKTGHRLNLDKPRRFTEKIQWYKCRYRNDKMLKCTDKYLVRDYVAKKLGSDAILNELYQVHTRADEIDFDILPEKFVIKTTDGGNGDNVLIVKDKKAIDKKNIIRLVNGWRNKKYYIISREWAYLGAQESKVIVEQYLEDADSPDGSLTDYKFLCYHGKFKYLWLDKDRYSNHKRGFWDENLNHLREIESDHDRIDSETALPTNIREMISVAEKLAEDFPFARVDLYNINGKIVFGEITFYPWSGYVKFTPDEFDFRLGEPFHIEDC